MKYMWHFAEIHKNIKTKKSSSYWTLKVTVKSEFSAFFELS